ncbi:MAG: hypothetical protein XE01_1199 [Synergistales bacterium 58_81]|nr:MAG: hypothetical protein XE01_1199 [Synergistales bacterium 58_81]
MTHFIAVTGSGPSQRGQDLFGVLNTGGLFEEKRAFVVEGADQLGPFPEGALDGLLRSGKSTVCLLVFEKDIAPGLNSLPEGSFSVRRPAKVPFWSRDRLQWLEREESLVVDEGGKQILALLDGLCQGDTSSVLRALSCLRRREEPLKITSALHKRMRIAMYLYRASPPISQAVESALEVKPYQGRLARKAVSIYPKSAIRDFVMAMARESAAGKSGLGRGWYGLELEILRLLSTLQDK